jgi:hypothetical protein
MFVKLESTETKGNEKKSIFVKVVVSPSRQDNVE